MTPNEPTSADSTTADLSTATDQELVRAVTVKHAQAFEELYERHSSTVYAVCLRVTRNRADAEELLTDVFWEFWSDPERYDPERAGLGAYLAVMARSRSLDLARRHSRRARITEESGAEETIGEILHTSPGQAESPDEAAVAGQNRSILGEALEQLSEVQRQALTLSFFDGMSHQEIAEHTGEPLGTVKGRIRQGLLHVRRSLSDRYGELT